MSTTKEINEVVIVERPTQKRSGSIKIKPYVDTKKENMGLEKYGLTLWEGVFHEEQLACLEMNGVKRYVTGLNEFAPEVKLLPEEQREAKAKEIRKVVSQLEKELAANIVDPEDKEFWNKLKLLKPDNTDFWGRINLRCGNTPVTLDIKNPYDLIKLYAIEAGGFSMVCKSYEEAKMSSNPPKFYLDKYQETITSNTGVKKLRAKALAELMKLFENNIAKLMYVAKVVDGQSHNYKKSTPHDIIYDNMDKFINGEGVEKNTERAAKEFLATANTPIEDLKIRALVKDATYFKYIGSGSDGFVKHIDTGVVMGRTPSEIFEFLKNPMNDKILGKLLMTVEKLWAD